MNKLRTQLVLVILLATIQANAQAPTGTIAGVVMNAVGTPIAGARLLLTNRDNGMTRRLQTSSEGDYTAASLPPGVYRVTAEADVFSFL